MGLGIFGVCYMHNMLNLPKLPPPKLEPETEEENNEVGLLVAAPANENPDVAA